MFAEREAGKREGKENEEGRGHNMVMVTARLATMTAVVMLFTAPRHQNDLFSHL